MAVYSIQLKMVLSSLPANNQLHLNADAAGELTVRS